MKDRQINNPEIALVERLFSDFNKKKASRKLPKEEWDFVGLPEDELQACLYFEYGRRSDLLCKKLAVFRRCFPSLPDFSDSFSFSRICKRFDEKIQVTLYEVFMSYARICLICSEFPEKPWRIINVSRKPGMEAVRWIEIERNLKNAKKVRNHPPLSKFHSDSFSVYDWSLTDKELHEEFQRWILKKRPCEPDFSPSGRIDSPSDLLNHLGVLRLWEHAKKNGYDVGDIELNKDRRTLDRSCKKAKDFLGSAYGIGANIWCEESVPD